VSATANSYAMDNDHVAATDQHQALADLLDEQTRTRIRGLSGWPQVRRCLDVGAGGGSIACWLADEIAGRGSEAQVVALDLKPGHIYIDGDHITLLDFDSFAGADPILDVANFLASLTLSPLRSGLPPDPSRRVGQFFVEEYFSHVPQNWRKRLPLLYAGTLLRKAVGSYRRQEPGWPNKVEVLLKEAEGSLVGRVW
jgi:SAM-dependent methyltransferase